MALLALLVVVATGCVSRKLMIRSQPSGATVRLEGKVVGATPYVEDFASYGQRRVELEMDGYRRLSEPLVLDRPWWQTVPIIDAFFEVVWPFTMHDEQTFDYVLEPLEKTQRADWSMDDARAAYERMQDTLR